MQLPIYMDYHATTPIDPRVLAAMTPYFTEVFGNPASRSHSFGWKASEAVERARQQVASLINSEPSEIYFTSGATESDNLAIKGVVLNQVARNAGRDGHIITTAIEHKAILESCKRAEAQGFEVTVLPVDRFGMVDPVAVERAITPRTVLVSVIAASNEVGTIEPLAEIGRITRARGILLHTDAAQAVGKVSVDVAAMNIDLLSLTAHKMYGPKGVGAIYIRGERPGDVVAPIADGGGQEGGVRSGTLNVAGIVGLGETCRINQIEMAAEGARLAALRDKLKQAILSGVGDVVVNGHQTNRLPNNMSISFANLDAETLLLSLNDIALSSGSACLSGSIKASHVIEALGVDERYALCTIRFGLGRFTTEEEVDYVARRMVEAVASLRELVPTSAR
ncbi:MAG: cysteine desulfurase [Acidobacteria bacterium]|nr:cysteine desulfurase [Acidobacteriota bacterium]